MAALALAGGLLCLVTTAYLYYVISKAPLGNEKMNEIAKKIQSGARAFLM